MDFDLAQTKGPKLVLGDPRLYTGQSRTITFRKAGTYRLTAKNVQTPEERGLQTLGEPNTLVLDRRRSLVCKARLTHVCYRPAPMLCEDVQRRRWWQAWGVWLFAAAIIAALVAGVLLRLERPGRPDRRARRARRAPSWSSTARSSSSARGSRRS